ncbi:MAG TPA: extracellular solute-binding protein [Phycisphaeraceae bacterium]
MAPVSAAFAQTPRGRSVRIDWDEQPLSGFESRPLSELASLYDLLVIDHPHVGEAAGCLLPLPMIADAFVGPSLASYIQDGQLWAVPIDAACHVSAYRTSSMPGAPSDWSQVRELAQVGTRIGLPLAGVHALMGMCTLLASLGAELSPERGWPDDDAMAEAATLYRWLVSVSDRRSLRWNPIQALEALDAGVVDYIPMTFGYSGFATAALRFAPVPAWTPEHGPTGAGVLGGTGLAVSSSTRHTEAAIAFAQFAASEWTQVNQWAQNGGQPAHRAAWEKLAVPGTFYGDTLAAFARAYVRPRFPGWNALQTRLGHTIETWLADDSASIRDLIKRLWTDWETSRELVV